jgi:NAD(P)-dependent dehydrogenase (short-subunit alcohol dehydrogenase family)
VSGYRGLPKALAYGPTKAALINLAESLYFDLTDHGIGVSVVCPGYVDTPLTAQNDYKMPGLISADQAALADRRRLEARPVRDPLPQALHALGQGLSHCWATGPVLQRPCAG